MSVLACINAGGKYISPMAIVKGKTLNARNIIDDVANTVYTYQNKAWMEDTLGVMWFRHHFFCYYGLEVPKSSC